jgi:hypothetical protein
MEQSKGLSKIEYWRKFELFALFEDLNNAEKLLTELSNNPAKDKSIEIFTNDFIEKLHDVEGSNVGDFTTIWEWFTPNKEWNIMTGQAGMDLGNRIFMRVDRWKRNGD